MSTTHTHGVPSLCHGAVHSVEARISSSYGLRLMAGKADEGSSSAAAATPVAAKEKYSESDVDESKPVTSIQIRLPDGTRLVGRFNVDAKVSKVHAFVAAQRPSLPAGFRMLESFPPRPIENYDKSVEEAGLVNASLSIKT